MEHTTITPLVQKVSRIGLGTWAIGGWMWGGTEKQTAIATVVRALEQGVNLIDTAPIYGFGMAEDIVGKALKQFGKRDKIVVATKLGLSWKQEKPYRDARAETLLKEVESSLKRMQIDYIDLYQVHWPDTATPMAETATALRTLLEQGKIRAIGVCNFSVAQMEEFQKNAPLHSLQSPFNLFEREIENAELAYCLEKKIPVLGYGSICRGLLSGHMTKTRIFKGDDVRKSDPKFQEPLYSRYLQCTEKLKKWAQQQHGRSLLSLAIRWALDKEIAVALWGARKPEQLDSIGSIEGWKLTAQDFAQIDQIIKESGLLPMGAEFLSPPHRKKSL